MSSVIPPERSGSIEWIVSVLAEGLVEAGHEVVLYAGSGSITTGELVTVVEEPGRAGLDGEIEHVLRAFADRSLDLVNDHSGLLAAALAASAPIPVAATVHHPLDEDLLRRYRLVAHLNPDVGLISVSEEQQEPGPDLPWVGNAPNALDLDAYPFSARKGDDLLFIGRMTPDKGAGRAVEVARRLGAHLRICGRMHGEAERAYFAREVAPYLGDSIEYLGEVAHEEKVRLLQSARCVLFPSMREEPFGLVVLEAAACGTPVVALARGAVPGVVEHGVTGYVVDDVEDMPGAVEASRELDPADCRQLVETTFSARRMVRSYLAAYEALLARRAT